MFVFLETSPIEAGSSTAASQRDSIDITIESVVKSPQVKHESGTKHQHSKMAKKEPRRKKSTSMSIDFSLSEPKTKRIRGATGPTSKDEVSITVTNLPVIPINSQEMSSIPKKGKGGRRSSDAAKTVVKKMTTGTIFCFFCDCIFTSDEKKRAADHYWSHIEPSLLQDPSMPRKSDKFTRAYSLSTAWIQEVIKFFEVSKELDVSSFNFRGCPVCRLVAPDIEKIERKAVSERDHMISHLQYKKYTCKVCMLSSEFECSKLSNRRSTVDSDSQSSSNCLTPEEDDSNDEKTEGLSPLDKVILQKDVLISVQSAKEDTILHTICKRDSIGEWSLKDSVKSNKRTVVKHIKEYHLSETAVDNDVLSRGFDLMTRGVVDVEDLVLEVPILAVEMLMSQLLVKPVSLLKKKTECVRIGDQVLTITRERCDPQVLAQDFRHSLLKPSFSFSPKISKSKKKRTIKTRAPCPPLEGHLETLISDSVGRLFPSPPYEAEALEDGEEHLKSLSSAPRRDELGEDQLQLKIEKSNEVDLTKDDDESSVGRAIQASDVTDNSHDLEHERNVLEEQAMNNSQQILASEQVEDIFQEDMATDFEALKSEVVNFGYKEEHSYSKPSSPIQESKPAMDTAYNLFDSSSQNNVGDDSDFITRLIEDLDRDELLDDSKCHPNALTFFENVIREDYLDFPRELPILSPSFVDTFFGDRFSMP
jgi:hypothetical protein